MVSLISGWGNFPLLYEHNIHNGEWKKEEQTQTWVSPKRKKGEVFGTLLAFCAFFTVTSVYSNKNPHTATRNANSSSRARRPGLWVHWSQLLAQQQPFSDHRLSLIVTNSSLLLTALGPYLFLVFFRSRRKSRAQVLCVGFAPKQTNESSDWQPHPHLHNECSTSCHSIYTNQNPSRKMRSKKFSVILLYKRDHPASTRRQDLLLINKKKRTCNL